MFMYSAPLAWLDKNFQLRPIDTLNFDIERQNLRQCLLNSRRDIKLVCVNATTERLRDEVTRGTTCLHYSGHGSPSHLSFEDGCGGLHVVDDKRLRSLCAAGGIQKLQFVFVSGLIAVIGAAVTEPYQINEGHPPIILGFMNV